MNYIKNILSKIKVFTKNTNIKSSIESHMPYILFSGYFGFTCCLNYQCYSYLLNSNEYVYIHHYRSVIL